MVNFQQGDKYYIPFKIKQGDTVVTDTSEYDVAIKIGDKVKKSTGTSPGVIFSEGYWMYKLEISDSQSFTENTPVQIGLKEKNNIQGDVMYSPIQYVNFCESLIKTEDWA